MFEIIMDIPFVSSTTMTFTVVNIAFGLLSYSNQKLNKKIYLED